MTTDLKTRTDELRRQAWLRAQTNPQPSPAAILAKRIKTRLNELHHDKAYPRPMH